MGPGLEILSSTFEDLDAPMAAATLAVEIELDHRIG
jgi:hypothetical protein